MISLQTYDLKTVEWIIIDDSDKEPCDKTVFFEKHPLRALLRRLRYIYLEKRVTIGHKRNLCKLLAQGDYLVHIDDYDYYHSNYLDLVSFIFGKTNLDVIGASEIGVIYPESPTFFYLGPYGPTRTCGGIMSYRRDYALQNNYNNYKKYGEEGDFLNGFHTPIFQIPKAYQYNLVLKHMGNSVDKTLIEKRPSTFLWLDFVEKDLTIISFYLSLYPIHLQFMRTKRGWEQLREIFRRLLDHIRQ